MGDPNGNGLLDPGETWTWTNIPVTINETTTFLAWGHAIDPWGNPVDYNQANPTDPTSFASEAQTVVVEVTKLTRTQGFWATHLDFTTYVFNTNLPGVSTLATLTSPASTNLWVSSGRTTPRTPTGQNEARYARL